MSSRTKRQGRGGISLTALAVLAVLLGVAAVGFGLVGQRPDPPSVAPQPVVEQQEDDAATTAEERVTVPPPSAPEVHDEVAVTPQEDRTGPAEEESASASRTDPGLPASPPVEVRIPAIGVTSPLHPLGLAADGTLEVPSGDLYDQAAWYDGSPTPGEVGPTVIEGHVTGAGGRASIFFELAALAPGDTVEVDRQDGRTVTFEVYRVDQFAKSSFPTVDVYGPTAGPELRVITCGGEFDDEVGHHTDNTVVYARMVSS